MRGVCDRRIRRTLFSKRATFSGACFSIGDDPTANFDHERGERVMADLRDVCDDRGLPVLNHDPAALEGLTTFCACSTTDRSRARTLRDLLSRSPEPLSPGAARQWE